MKLTDNTILITGATAGIGLAFAREFHNRGNQVIACGRRAERLASLEKELPGLATRVVDISIAEERESLAVWAVENFPELNVLFNNAGMQLAADLTKPVDLANVENEFETNLVAPIHLASLLTPHLATREPSTIVNITSGLAFAPIAFMPIYCASKAAMHSYTMSLRYQLRNTPIQIFEIAPPSVDTELGYQRRADPTQSHGGLPVEDFLREAMEALANDTLEAPIAHAKVLYAGRDSLFSSMNK